MKTKTGYWDASLPIEERVEKLLAVMSLEEKAAQVKARGLNIREIFGQVLEGMPEESREKLQREFFGPMSWRMYMEGRDSHAALVGAGWKRNWKRLVLDGEGVAVGELSLAVQHFDPREGAELANEMQKYVRENTRLGIPLIIHDECLHGCIAKGSSSFPQSIGMAASFDPDLVHEIAVAIGKETRVRGISQCLSPTINITRDARCSRTEETYGEDPRLSAAMARAFVIGVQSQGVAATPKHFAVNFAGPGGRDSNEVQFSERKLREVFFPAFEAAVRAGALSLMPAYNAMDGVACSSNRWLLTDILRKEWGFQGFTASDYTAVARQISHLGVADDKAAAAKMALEAGMDMELPASDCYEEVLGLVKSGRLSEKVLDESVRRILRVKFILGLFDNPFTDSGEAARVVDCADHRALALRAARESIVLLANDGTLPLSRDISSVAVIGPSATRANIGEYSGFGMKVVTPLEGIKQTVSSSTQVHYAQGCGITSQSKDGFAEALSAAAKSDAVILCVGNSPETEGEGRDRSSLDLPGVQEQLILELSETGKPIVVVLLSGGAVTMEKWIRKVGAIVDAFYPGEEGGNAVAEVLFGECNPSGKLPVTFPKRTGQLPLYYNPEPSGRGYTYVDLRGDQPQFPFGHGLSYSRFDYGSLTVDPESVPAGKSVSITCQVANAGGRKGTEVVQLYIRDEVARITRPIMELKGFQRVALEAGEKRTVSFAITPDDLAFWDTDMKRVVEPGRFQVMIGASSADIRLRGSFTLQKGKP